ncbi:MAG TPA: hypothetical protein VLL52_04630 [Anaerolineae bacterium]|nr:hypothetical protein [Anaerolineae bacterium]
MMSRRLILSLLIGLTLFLTGIIYAALGPLGTDTRITTTGPAGNKEFDAFDPAVAYSSNNDQYLVVWAGNATTDTTSIYGQLVTASTGTNTGVEFTIHNGVNSTRPAVAYNSTNDQYLVVWQDIINSQAFIYGTLVNGDGTIANNAVQISAMGAAGFNAFYPDVTYNANSNEFMVVWFGRGPSEVEGENEVYGHRLDNAGATTSNQIKISSMGGITHSAYHPAIAYNTSTQRYLIVWHGDTNDVGTLVTDEYEIFGQFLNNTGDTIGSRFRISEVQPDANSSYDAVYPDITYNADSNQFLVAWMEDNNTIGDNTFEIYAQLLNGGGGQSGSDFRISTTLTGTAALPSITYNPNIDTYLVTWRGDTNADLGNGSLATDEFEIFGQMLDISANASGSNFRISSMGNTDGDATYQADHPMVIANTNRSEFYVVWHGDDEIVSGGDPTVDNEVEIFSQRICGQGLPNTVSVTVTPSGTSANLTWPIDPNANTYEIYSHNDPNTNVNLLATTSNNSYEHLNAVGDTALNHYYIIYAINGCSQFSSASNHAGEFDVAIYGGTP